MLGCIDPPRRAGQPLAGHYSSLVVRPSGPHGRKALFLLFSGDLDRSEAGLGRTVGLSRYQPARIADRRAAESSSRHSRSTHAWPFSPIALALAGSRSNSVTRAATPGPSLTTKPVSPLRMASGAPPESPPITGRPVADASR